MKVKKVSRLLAFTMAAGMCFTDVAGSAAWNYTMEVEAAETQEDVINGTATYEFDKSSTWDTNNDQEINAAVTTATVPAVGTTLNLDILIPVTNQNRTSLTFSGSLKTIGILRLGTKWTWIKSGNMPELTAANFAEKVTISGKEYYKASTSIEFGETVGANDPTQGGAWNDSASFESVVTEAVSQVTVQMAGYQCDYAGDIVIANANLTNTEGASEKKTVINEQNFDAGIGSWIYDSGWNYQYDGAANTSTASENGMLKLMLDYSNNATSTWSQPTFTTSEGLSIKGANTVDFDFYYNPTLLGSGSFMTKLTLQYKSGEVKPEVKSIESTGTIDTENAENVDSPAAGMKKAHVTLSFDEFPQETCTTMGLAIIGDSTGYKGAAYIDNLVISKIESAVDVYVNSTLKVTGAEKTLSVADGKLNTYSSTGAEQKADLATSIKLVDEDATAEAKAVYSYLASVGDTDSVIFGHQNDTWHKAGSAELSDSDTRDVTGSISGVVGIDTLSLTGNEYSASRYNSEILKITEATPGEATPSEASLSAADKLPETPAGNVTAAALLTNLNIEEGALITLSAHMPNFSLVKENASYTAGDPTYAKYDFSGYTPNTIAGDVANEILPGGKYNEVYTAYLDMIADYASQVDGAILFRPFHENTGSWFWWGAAFCDAQTYKNIYRYTVDYLRDVKDIHNMLYEYGPSSEASNTDEYGLRYPGDDYVDIVGFDMYHSNPSDDDTWFDNFENELAIVESFAKTHNKLIAVTETGVANSADPGDNQTALHKTGNQQLDWYNKMLDKVAASEASYFLLWANFSEKDGFYTPYVKSVNEDGTFYGHEELDYFIDFFNDPRSIFAVNQKDALSTLYTSSTITAEPVSEAAKGYITAPISGKRILSAAKLTANVTGTAANVSFILRGANNVVVQLPASKGTGAEYTASLSAADLAKLGAFVGTLELSLDGTVVDSINAIYNIEEPEEDPYMIDNFESYYGVDSMLTQKWATNKNTGCTIDVSLSSEEGTYSEGTYGMKFSYNEIATANDSGWAGATISKEVDWSNCNALQFWTIPDGNKQKVVIQLTANSIVYEAYLNNYADYTNNTKPMLVTIPFSEFVQRDTEGHPAGGLVTDCKSLSSFGLWVNTIVDDTTKDKIVDGMIAGTIYYDNITAVKTAATEATFEIKKDAQAALNVSGVTASPAYGTSFTLNTTGGSGTGAVSYAVTSGSQYAKVDANGKVTVTGVGAVTITVTKAADGNYNEQTKTISFTSVKAAQSNLTITGIANKGKLAAGKAATLKVTGGTGTGAVTYKVTKGTKYAKVDSKSGKVTVTGIGAVTITATKAADANYTAKTATVSFTTTLPAKNAKVTVGSLKYQVTKSASKNGTVTCYAPAKTTAASVSVPATVKIGGVTFKVTAISKNAFKNCKKLKTVTIGNNVTTIGDSAFANNTALTKVTMGTGIKTIGKSVFSGDSKLKTITIKSKKLTKAGASSLKDINKKAVIKVPSAKVKAYTKLLKGKGQASTVKIKK